MALKKATEDTQESSVSTTAKRTMDVFSELAKKRERGEINTTVTISFRVLKSERERIEKIMNQNGFSLAAGAKKAVYDFLKTLANN